MRKLTVVESLFLSLVSMVTLYASLTDSSQIPVLSEEDARKIVNKNRA